MANRTLQRFSVALFLGLALFQVGCFGPWRRHDRREDRRDDRYDRRDDRRDDRDDRRDDRDDRRDERDERWD